MRVSWKDAAALTIAGLALLASWFAVGRMSNVLPEQWSVASGIHLTYRDGQVSVLSVDPGSAGWQEGILPGWIVTSLNDRLLSGLPSYERERLAAEPNPILSIGVMEPGASATPAPGTEAAYSTYYSFTRYSYARNVDVGQMFLGLILLIGGWWLLRTGRLGAALRPYAVTLPVATALPLLLVPLDMYGGNIAPALVWCALVAGTCPLALGFASALPTRRQRVSLRVLALIVLAGAAGVGLLYVMANQTNDWWPLYRLYEPITRLFGTADFFRFALVVLITVVPGVLALMPLVSEQSFGAPGSDDDAPEGATIARSGRFAGALDLALGAITPAVAGVTLLSSNNDIYPIVLWLTGLFVARWLGVQPLVRLVQRTSLQRDLVMSATERERARIAGDIHDYALQDLTMLVRRLDAAGDVDNATAAREVADRLRAICGDLRLPILDDLGVGPALDWLVGRLEPDREKLELELSDRELRLTPDAELAFFRVAQEAIANAIHHGSPPISVRYWGGGDWAELIVDDCGPGIPVGAAEAAERTGHMGLMTMSQRAEAIGAELTLGRRPGGGARVHMTWERAGTEPAAEVARPTEPVAGAEPGAQPA